MKHLALIFQMPGDLTLMVRRHGHCEHAPVSFNFKPRGLTLVRQSVWRTHDAV